MSKHLSCALIILAATIATAGGTGKPGDDATAAHSKIPLFESGLFFQPVGLKKIKQPTLGDEFRLFDTDQDGTVTRQEFIAASTAAAAAMDTNHDGYIEYKEYIAYYCGGKVAKAAGLSGAEQKKLREECRTVHTRIFKKIDKAGTGKPSLADAQNAAAGQFQLLDRDARGSINIEDLFLVETQTVAPQKNKPAVSGAVKHKSPL